MYKTIPLIYLIFLCNPVACKVNVYSNNTWSETVKLFKFQGLELDLQAQLYIVSGVLGVCMLLVVLSLLCLSLKLAKYNIKQYSTFM